jgi:hypothetical protein
LVVNTFTVTADTDEVQDTTATGVASIIIGNPPTGCFVPVGNNWPGGTLSMVNRTITALVGRYPLYAARVCSGFSQITIRYAPGTCGAWGCYSGGNITLTSGGLGNEVNALYILSHESGHALADGTGSFYQAYEDAAGVDQERPLCTYSAAALYVEENFAEAIGLYASGKSFPCLGGSFQSRYPYHYQFVDEELFN